MSLTRLSSAVLLVVFTSALGCSRDAQKGSKHESTTASDSAVSPATAQHKDIYRIYDEFISAKAVATACNAATAEINGNHDSKFLIVSHAVQSELKKRGRSDSFIKDFLRGHNKLIRYRTIAMLKSHPCDSKDAKIIIQRYKAQANWKPPVGS